MQITSSSPAAAGGRDMPPPAWDRSWPATRRCRGAARPTARAATLRGLSRVARQEDVAEVRRQHAEHAGQVLVAAAGEDQQTTRRRKRSIAASAPAPVPRRRCGAVENHQGPASDHFQARRPMHLGQPGGDGRVRQVASPPLATARRRRRPRRRWPPDDRPASSAPIPANGAARVVTRTRERCVCVAVTRPGMQA